MQQSFVLYLMVSHHPRIVRLASRSFKAFLSVLECNFFLYLVPQFAFYDFDNCTAFCFSIYSCRKKQMKNSSIVGGLVMFVIYK